MLPSYRWGNFISRYKTALFVGKVFQGELVNWDCHSVEIRGRRGSGIGRGEGDVVESRAGGCERGVVGFMDQSRRVNAVSVRECCLVALRPIIALSFFVV